MTSGTPRNTPLLIFRTAALLISAAGLSFRLIAEPLQGGGWRHFFNTLGYFTIQSNLLVLAVFLLLLVHQLRGTPEKEPSPGLRGAALLYILMTSGVFLLLLNSRFETTGLSRFVLYINHAATALLLLTDCLLTLPRGALNRKMPGYWLVYPLAYWLLSIPESLITGNFRYFFLNYRDFGTGPYLLAILLIAAAFYALGLLIVRLNRPRRKNTETV